MIYFVDVSGLTGLSKKEIYKHNGGIMKKLLVSMMLILGMLAFAAESAPSSTVGYVKYVNVAGNNYMALPMQAGFSMASSFEAHSTSAVYKYDSAQQKWVGSDMLFPGFWNNDYVVSAGQPYWIYCTAVNDLIVDGEVLTNPAYNLVVGNNGVMVPLDKSAMTMASSYEGETGAAVTAVYKYDTAQQKWVGSDMLFPGFWNNDFVVGIADPHWVYSTSALSWPSKNIPLTEYDGVIPHGGSPKGDPKGIYVGVLMPDGVTEYDAGTLADVTFQAWLQQGTGLAITEPSLNGAVPTSPYTEITQIGDGPATTAMVATRGTVQFNLQEFTIWGLDNVLNIMMRDESDGAKVFYEETIQWIIDDVSLAPKGIGMEPFMAGTGLPIGLINASSIDGNMPLETKLEQNYPNPF
ncbi:MAG: hypothetical protein KAS62_11265, partial [Candidatus Delongbacteria bacterium]|nr:hypothetical protein [Candidatus Delongbacteria bacterium]